MTDRIKILREYIDGVLLARPIIPQWQHPCAHLHSVALTCALIALKRGEDAELATMAGMLHDFYTYKYKKDFDEHGPKGAVLAREVLAELGLTSEEETEMICTAIHNHSDKQGEFDAFTEILIDADVMQHCLYDITMPVADREIDRFTRLCEEFGLHEF